LLKDKESPTRKIITTEFQKEGIATAVVMVAMTIQYGRYFGFTVTPIFYFIERIRLVF
jgi:hypothetical protein